MTSDKELESRLKWGLEKLAIAADDRLCEQLLVYLRELTSWNQAYNLTAVREPEEMVTRHLLDSLAVMPWLRGERALDVGTGAGLPGIPLALAQPERNWTLLDANGKKVRFLRHVIRTLGLERVDAVQERVERYQPDTLFDCVTARAFSGVTELLASVTHLVASRARVLALRGRSQSTLLMAGFQLRELHRLEVPGLDAERHLMVIEAE